MRWTGTAGASRRQVAGSARQEFLLGPMGFCPLRNVTPLRAGGTGLIIERRCGVVPNERG